MFHVSFEYLWAGHSQLDLLNNRAEEEISTRGWSTRALIPADLADPEWFLSVSDIAYSYCPTDRYLYFKKIENKRAYTTWPSFQGRILDDLIPKIYENIFKYSIETKISRFNLVKNCGCLFDDLLEDYRKQIDDADIEDDPGEEEHELFIEYLKKLITYEVGVASSFLNFRVSNLFDINVEAEFRVLFPFDFKLKLLAPRLGISGSAECDFLFNRKIIGEVKSSKWYEFYNVGLAAYALAYEVDRTEKVNLGVVVCPLFEKSRNVPLYKGNSKIKIINEIWRKIFITNRNKRIELVKNEIDPGKPRTLSKCKGCGYYRECW